MKLTNFCKYYMLGVCGQLITMNVCTCWRRVHQYLYVFLCEMCNFGEEPGHTLSWAYIWNGATFLVRGVGVGGNT